LHADAEILTKLFVLCDETGDEVVDAQKFMAVASMLVAADTDRKFAMAFSFYDFASSGKISQDDAIAAVTSMNCCAEWFGDLTMKKAEVEALVESV
jgi:Ca2+-binding EF-hand superfamily protein